MQAIDLFRNFTFRKNLNFLKLRVSFYVSRIIGYPFHWGKPFSIAIEPTNICNLRCVECPTGTHSLTRELGRINNPLVRKIVDEQKKYLINLMFYFQGEPYLHPELFDLIQYAYIAKIHTSISTNGHFLNDENARKTIESGLSRIIISIDGATQEVYQKYRVAGNLSTVIQGIINLVRWKKQLNSTTPKIVMQFLVFSFNEHEMNKIRKLKKQLGADKLIFKSAQINDLVNHSTSIPSIEEYSRYRLNELNTFSLKSTIGNFCWRMWSSSVITWQGDVVPCCFDKDADFKFGNVSVSPFYTIWNSKTYRKFRKQIFSNRKKIAMCGNCTEGLII